MRARSGGCAVVAPRQPAFPNGASPSGTGGGITSNFSEAGKVIIVLLMYPVRIGPVVLGMALFHAPTVTPSARPEEDIAI